MAPVSVTLASIFSVHGVGPRSVVSTQNCGGLPVPRFCLNVNSLALGKGFQFTGSLIVVVALGGLFFPPFFSLANSGSTMFGLR